MIRFLAADANIRLKQRQHVRAWLNHVADAASFQIAELNYIFSSDAFLLEMNRDYLQHDYYTDIITFPITEAAGIVHGECYLSVDRIRDNAKQLGANFTDELHRVMAHGLLHLMGQGDKTKAEALAMRRREDEALAMRTFHVEPSGINRNKL